MGKFEGRSLPKVEWSSILVVRWALTCAAVDNDAVTVAV